MRRVLNASVRLSKSNVFTVISSKRVTSINLCRFFPARFLVDIRNFSEIDNVYLNVPFTGHFRPVTYRETVIFQLRPKRVSYTCFFSYFVSFLLPQGPIVPCTHALLAKWIPPNERSRMGAFVYAGQFVFYL